MEEAPSSRTGIISPRRCYRGRRGSEHPSQCPFTAGRNTTFWGNAIFFFPHRERSVIMRDNKRRPGLLGELCCWGELLWRRPIRMICGQNSARKTLAAWRLGAFISTIQSGCATPAPVTDSPIMVTPAAFMLLCHEVRCRLTVPGRSPGWIPTAPGWETDFKPSAGRALKFCRRS